MIARVRWVFLLLALLGAGQARTQADSTLFARGVQAYIDVEFGTAVSLLSRWLSSAPPGTPDSQRVRALTYLGAAEVLRGRTDSAEAAFRRLLQVDPQATVDPLIFPPAIGRVFTSTRARTRVVSVVAPPLREVRIGGDWSAVVRASTPHTVEATIRRLDGRDVRTIYHGLVGDSAIMRWDGADASGRTVASGNYQLEVRSLSPAGGVERVVQVPLDIEAIPADTLPHPVLPDSLLRPERRGTGPGIEALAGGILAGVAVIALPSAFAPESELSPARFAVGGAISLSGLLGFLTRRPGGAIPANQAYNDSVRTGWRARMADLGEANAARRARARLVIHAGAPTVLDMRGR